MGCFHPALHRRGDCERPGPAELHPLGRGGGRARTRRQGHLAGPDRPQPARGEPADCAARVLCSGAEKRHNLAASRGRHEDQERQRRLGGHQPRAEGGGGADSDRGDRPASHHSSSAKWPDAGTTYKNPLGDTSGPDHSRPEPIGRGCRRAGRRHQLADLHGQGASLFTFALIHGPKAQISCQGCRRYGPQGWRHYLRAGQRGPAEHGCLPISSAGKPRGSRRGRPSRPGQGRTPSRGPR